MILKKNLFDKIGPKAKKRGYLTFKEFYDICMWKSARPKKKYLKNQKRTVEDVTKKALSEKDERSRIQILTELHGIEIPTASTILTVIFPESYAVIDIRCVEMVQEKFNLELKKSISMNVWINYLEEIRKQAKDFDVTPRELEKALFAMHKEKLDRNSFQNLY